MFLRINMTYVIVYNHLCIKQKASCYHVKMVVNGAAYHCFFSSKINMACCIV